MEQYEYYNTETGEVYEDYDHILDNAPASSRPVVYHDRDYEVVALVVVPNQMNYRYYSGAQFVMGADTFFQETGSSAVMYYALDMEHDNPQYNEDMDSFLADYTENIADAYGYESRKKQEGEFSQFRNMFTFVGSVLSLVVGLVGILNFMNSIVTGILSRKRELAVLQAVGMTGRQLKQMLILEGLYESIGSILVTVAFTILTAPFAGNLLGSMFWFLTYQFTITPVLIIAPLFALLGIMIPYLSYQFMMKKSVVERLREAE